jgi:hypothetical protein
MTYLAENPLPTWIVGFLLVFLAWVTYLNLRTTKTLLLIPAAVLLMVGLLLAEWWIETPREAVRRALDEVMATVEADDLPGTLARISNSPSAAAVRADAKTLMPLVTVDQANVIDVPNIDVDLSANPPEAVALVQAFFDVTMERNGMRQPVLDWVHVTFVLEDGRWLVREYMLHNEQFRQRRDGYRRRGTRSNRNAEE